MDGVAATKRIDAGIKRGPRKSLEARRRSPKADLGSWIIPPDLKPQDVIERYLTESTTSQIAAQYGLSRKALVRWLRSTLPAEWKEVQLVRAHCRIEDGEDGIEGSCDALSLARAREQVKAAQFRLTALDKDYHPKQELTVVVQPILTINTSPIPALPQPSQVIDLPSDAVQRIEPVKP